MREVVITENVRLRIEELGVYLTQAYGMSRESAHARVGRMYRFLASLKNPGDYARCRFRKWRELGYLCVPFEGWVFAYQAFIEGVIIRDMSHAKAIDETD